MLLRSEEQASRRSNNTSAVAAYFIDGHKIMSPATIYADVHGTYCRQSTEQKIKLGDDDDDDGDDDYDDDDDDNDNDDDDSDNMMFFILFIEAC